jgi:hypothetical protein
MRGFKIAHGRLGKQLRTARARVALLFAQRRDLPKVSAFDDRSSSPVKVAITAIFFGSNVGPADVGAVTTGIGWASATNVAVGTAMPGTRIAACPSKLSRTPRASRAAPALMPVSASSRAIPTWVTADAVANVVGVDAARRISSTR